MTKSISSVSDVWVTYKTSHPSGFFYLGKSSIRRIQAGYQGSGPKFRCVLFHSGFEPTSWITTILSEHDDECAAFIQEATIVPLSILTNPFCLNTQPGGKARCYGSPYVKVINSFKTKRSKKPNKALPKGLESKKQHVKGLK